MFKNLEWLKGYITDENYVDISKSRKHMIYSLKLDDVLEAEKRMGFCVPEELRRFYIEYGYGFICRGYKSMFNRMIDPGSLASCWLSEGEYEDYSDNSPYSYYSQKYLAFFEVAESSYLAIKMDDPDSEGRCPVYDGDKRIADSIEDFVNKMNEKCNYFIDFEESK